MPSSDEAAPRAAAYPTFLVTISCPDRIGVVADTARFLVENGCNIVESAQYGDPDSGRFFLRTAFESQQGAGLDALRAAFEPIAVKYAMDAAFYDQGVKMPALLLVSKLGHCLNDLLYRWRAGALPIDIKGVISNHLDFKHFVETSYGLPFTYIPIEKATKAADMQRLGEAMEGSGAELFVLARYMQVLTPALCDRFSGRVINIHHSFLPSFMGARPYQRAHERGVKLIGATAHYVTSDLDEGPIIEQSVERVRHNQTTSDYVAVGRDVEAVVLARAVKWHAERRILMNGHRTVVF
ncbi:MAG: formyltetrahydrofolate deformylase [Caulobacterales bacterium]